MKDNFEHTLIDGFLETDFVFYLSKDKNSFLVTSGLRIKFSNQLNFGHLSHLKKFNKNNKHVYKQV